MHVPYKEMTIYISLEKKFSSMNYLKNDFQIRRHLEIINLARNREYDDFCMNFFNLISNSEVIKIESVN